MTSLGYALLVTWGFWSGLVVLLMVTGRSWLPVWLFPLVISGVLWAISWVSGDAALALALVGHGVFLVWLGYLHWTEG